EGESRRFRAVMMTAVSFIIGVLRLMLATAGRGQKPPHICTNVFIGILVGNLVEIFLITV
ncbi:hypothetical protein ACVGXS_12845, partial [Enterobacter hormaechei]